MSAVVCSKKECFSFYQRFLSPIAVAHGGGGLDTPSSLFSERPSPPFGLSPAPGGSVAALATPPPPPDWSAMTSEELKRRMAEYGLQAGTDKFMREKLQEIWL